jgi:gamma-glutamyltranspeptidase/glutathione hydrolase
MAFFSVFLISFSAHSANKQTSTGALLNFNARILPTLATKGMIASQESRATKVGVSILEKGGNAVDAAVAVGFALAVTLPRAGNLGGGGFMMIFDKQSGVVKALDYREKAPKAAYRDMFLDKELNVDNQKARFSVLSAGVPGTVAGLIEAHRKHGKLPLAVLIEPAIILAKELPMSFAMAESLNRKKRYLSRSPASLKTYYKADGSPWTINDTLVQNELAAVLKGIQQTNGKSFYHGETATKITEFVKANGGIMTMQDFASYKAVWRKPLMAEFGDATIYSMPPPSSGGVHLVQLLNIMQNFPIKKAGPNTAYSVHMTTEAMKFAYADRSQYLGDPDFVDVPIKKLTSVDYANRIASKISPDKVLKSSDIAPGMYISNESPQTTHYSVVDKDGNMVSNTYTLNFSFGSGITVPGTGVLLNNEMDDFSAKTGVPNGYGLLGADANAIEAEKRPLSSMTPVLVLNNDEPWLATGSPGGSRIITIVYNFLMNKMVHDMNIASATLEPRIHHQWYPEVLMLEKGFPIDTATLLQQKGHNIKYYNPWGSLQSVELKGGVFFGFADTRRPGALAEGSNK